MARIRSVKPDFHTDRRLALDLTRDQRLFYQGMWNFADDEGRMVADPRGLLGEIFRYEKDLDERWVEDLLVRLAVTGRAVLYEVGGEQICQLTKFSKHQKISHPTPSRLAPPPKKMASPLGWLSGRYSGAIPGGSPETLRPDVEVEVEVEGSRDQGEGGGTRARESASPEVNPEPHPVDAFQPTDEHRALAAEVRVPLDDVTRDWRLHRKANGVYPADLAADLARWILREPDFATGNGNGGAHPEPPARVSPPVYVPPADEPPFDPRAAKAGLELVKQAVAATRPLPAPKIDDPETVARREAERERQRALIKPEAK